MTNVNNMYTQTMQSLKRPQEIAQSGILPDEVSTNIDSRCRDLTKRVGRLPAVVLKTHKRFVFESASDINNLDITSNTKQTRKAKKFNLSWLISQKDVFRQVNNLNYRTIKCKM